MVEASVFVTKLFSAGWRKIQRKLSMTFILGFNRFNFIVTSTTSNRKRRVHWIKRRTIRSEGRLPVEPKKPWYEESPPEKWNKPLWCGEEVAREAKETVGFKKSKRSRRRA